MAQRKQEIQLAAHRYTHYSEAEQLRLHAAIQKSHWEVAICNLLIARFVLMQLQLSASRALLGPQRPVLTGTRPEAFLGYFGPKWRPLEVRDSRYLASAEGTFES